ncbi:MAG: hypothetical protein ABJC04_00205 [Verrucomicrobiota bacterium]
MTKILFPPMPAPFQILIRKKNAPVAPILHSGKKASLGAFFFQTRLASECICTIEASQDLRGWTLLSSGRNRSGDVLQTDPAAAKFSFRFYRATVGGLVSRNVVGYATVVLPQGFSMIANPFFTFSTAISDLFPDVSDGTTLCKLDSESFRLTNNTVRNGRWVGPDETLSPGEGAIFFNPENELKNLYFTGEVCQGRLVNAIPAGLSIRSSLVPQSGKLDTDLGFPIAEGDVIHAFDRFEQKYRVYPYTPKSWKNDAPVIGIGESFWVSKKTPANWVRKFLPR